MKRLQLTDDPAVMTPATAQPAPDTVCSSAFLAAPVLHAGALFSNSFILAEGRMLGFGLATLTLLLARQALPASPRPAWQQQSSGNQQQQSQHQQHATERAAVGSEAPEPKDAAPAVDAVRTSHVQQPEGRCHCKEPDAMSADGPGRKSSTAACLQGGAVSDFDAASSELIAARAGDGHSTVHILATAAAALMLLWALGQRGLVVRSGHDAMWRTAAEHRTVLPPDATAEAQSQDAGSPWTAATVTEYMPLAALPVLLLFARRRMLTNGR